MLFSEGQICLWCYSSFFVGFFSLTTSASQFLTQHTWVALFSICSAGRGRATSPPRSPFLLDPSSWETNVGKCSPLLGCKVSTWEGGITVLKLNSEVELSVLHIFDSWSLMHSMSCCWCHFWYTEGQLLKMCKTEESTHKDWKYRRMTSSSLCRVKGGTVQDWTKDNCSQMLIYNDEIWPTLSQCTPGIPALSSFTAAPIFYPCSRSTVTFQGRRDLNWEQRCPMRRRRHEAWWWLSRQGIPALHATPGHTWQHLVTPGNTCFQFGTVGVHCGW